MRVGVLEDTADGERIRGRCAIETRVSSRFSSHMDAYCIRELCNYLKYSIKIASTAVNTETSAGYRDAQAFCPTRLCICP